jgi:hypothetical protein
MNIRALRILSCVLTLLAPTLAAAAPLTRPATVPPTSALPSGLPTTFWLGLAIQPGELPWMSASGVPWNARYQYLTGGVNTGAGWATWWPGNGNFARDYMQASQAAGYLPVFTYYQLMYSQPRSGADESEWDYNTLNNPTTMAAYFQDFALLLQKAAEFGRPVVIQVEPDFWGYMHRRVHAGSNSAADIPAAVARSGYAGLGGYPDTVQGFAQALLHLRDTLAPRALLAIHASHWSTDADVSTSRDPGLDAAAVGRATGAFLNSAGLQNNPPGLRPWDLVFVDPSDRDADWYRVMANDGGSRWWDPTDATLPNFARYRAWVAALHATTDRRVVLWQMPIGNDVSPTQNNAPGHFKDNRVTYFLGGAAPHLQEWIDAGVVGILWGRGNDQCTSYTDDGGYLRDQAAAYYKRGPLPLPTGSAAPAPAAAGATVPALDLAHDPGAPTGFRVGARFQDYWAAHGGLPIFGYPISGERQERNAADGRTYIVQWFERARFEWHPENSGPFTVLLGHLGRQMAAGRVFPGVTAFPTTADRRYIPETGHSLSGRFLQYWQATGGLAQHGYPISEPFAEVNPTDGQSYTVQYFERARFELHPANPAPYDVLLGLLGRQLYQP